MGMPVGTVHQTVSVVVRGMAYRDLLRVGFTGNLPPDLNRIAELNVRSQTGH
jgi:hypothetical protein